MLPVQTSKPDPMTPLAVRFDTNSPLRTNVTISRKYRHSNRFEIAAAAISSWGHLCLAHPNAVDFEHIGCPGYPGRGASDHDDQVIDFSNPMFDQLVVNLLCHFVGRIHEIHDLRNDTPGQTQHIARG